MKQEPEFEFRHGRGGVLHAQVPWKLQDAEWATQHTIAVYAAVRRYTNFGGTQGARPSIPLIVAKSHVSRAQVIRELKKLREHGWIEWVPGKKGVANQYLVHLDPDAPADPYLVETTQSLVDTEVVSGRDGGKSLGETLPISSIPISNTKSTERADSILAVFAYWQTSLGYSDRRLTKTRKAKINARLEDGFTVDQLKAVVDYVKTDEFLRGKNDRNTAYDDIDNIFRSTERVEKYLGKKPDPRRTGVHRDGQELDERVM